MKRRKILLAGLGVLGHLVAHATAAPDDDLLRHLSPAASASDRRMPHGRLMIIGGAEDRSGERVILRRFIELSGKANPQIAVLPAASAFPDFVWNRYGQVLADLGVRRRVVIMVNSAEEANDAQLAERILESDGVLLTGGDQRRLVNLIGGTAIEQAIHRAYREGGACIAGTSAGAAAMSQRMLAGRGVSDGMGLLQGAIVDQHFSERRRLSRLLSAVASNPHLIGIGVDEDTALVVNKGRGLEVLGAGTVTIVDGRRLPQALTEVDPELLLQRPEIEVRRLQPMRGAT